MDLENLTLSLLHHTVPGLLQAAGSKLTMLTDPRGQMLAKLCAMCLVVLHRMRTMQKGEGVVRFKDSLLNKNIWISYKISVEYIPDKPVDEWKFEWMKFFSYWFEFHRWLYLRVRLRVNHHYRQTFSIIRILVGNKIVHHSDVVVALLQLHLHSWLNTQFQWIGQTLQDETRSIYVLGIGVTYMRGFTIVHVMAWHWTSVDQVLWSYIVSLGHNELKLRGLHFWIT